MPPEEGGDRCGVARGRHPGVRAAARASSLNPLRLSLLTAAAVGCVAFATDYYLLKSFPLALLWWYVVVLALRLPPPAGRPARPGPR